MIDVRPLSIDVPLEIIFEGGRESAGMVDMSPDLKYDIAADNAIDTVLDAAMFREAKVEYFDFAFYWRTFHGMMADFEDRWKDEIILADEVIQRAKSLYKERRPKVKFRLGMRMKLGKYERIG